MRSLAFNIAFGAISVFYTLLAALAALAPGRGRVRAVVRRYVRAMVWAMDAIAGIHLEVRGRERLPQGAYILAPKHASYGDGFTIYSQFDDLAFVTGDHLERFPLFKTVLRKLGAIVVDSCGGPEARRALSRSAAEAHAEGRKILIYPEGALAPVGAYYRYKTGVFHMARDFDVPVVPVASSLGLFWTQENWTKRPGTAVLEFLDPIPTGLPRQEFMERLQTAVEDRTAELVAEATGRPVKPAVLGVPDDEKKRVAKAGAPVNVERTDDASGIS
ncbi:MAG TPA: lysophospholipid acyltransferase family protein [Caulobacteraceae bacterium]|jgi:1-acyl-sn-glycerol-3-phosphate acyltransferase